MKDVGSAQNCLKFLICTEAFGHGWDVVHLSPRRSLKGRRDDIVGVAVPPIIGNWGSPLAHPILTANGRCRARRRRRILVRTGSSVGANRRQREVPVTVMGTSGGEMTGNSRARALR